MKAYGESGEVKVLRHRTEELVAKLQAEFVSLNQSYEKSLGNLIETHNKRVAEFQSELSGRDGNAFLDDIVERMEALLKKHEQMLRDLAQTKSELESNA